MFPLVGLLLFHCLPQWLVPGPLALGILYLTLLPSTIQSSLAFTSIAGGNVPAAMCSATLSSLVGTIATPLLVGIFAATRGGAPTGDAIGEIGLLLVAPLLAGQCLRPWIGGFVLRHKAILSATDRGSILLVVYGAFGQAVNEGLWRALPLSGFVIMRVLGLMVLAVMIFATRSRKGSASIGRITIAIVFCGSKKSLAAGVPMAGCFRLPRARHRGLATMSSIRSSSWSAPRSRSAGRRKGRPRRGTPRAVAPPLGAMSPAR